MSARRPNHKTIVLFDPNEDTSWHDKAACKAPADWSIDQVKARLDLFFPENGRPGPEPFKMCARCPVIEQCRAAQKRRNELGVWAGRVSPRKNVRGHSDKKSA